MEHKKLNRRDFFARGAQAGVVGCAFFMGLHNLSAMHRIKGLLEGDGPIDPAQLNFCGYQCPGNCLWLRGTLENRTDLKKEAYEQWKIKGRMGLDFNPGTMFCYGCKTRDRPEGFILNDCTVRPCCMEKGLDCCIQCDELSLCDKELWGRFPDFYESVKEMQVKYRAQQG